MQDVVIDSYVGKQVRTKLKWFNELKGFGFVVPDNTDIDAFLHIAVLRSAGIDGLGEGARLLCHLAKSPKGAAVKEVISVIDAGLSPRPYAASNHRVIPSTITELTGTVKWYKPESGFGFAAADDRGKDVYLPQKLLRRYGLQSLESRTPVLMKVRTTAKGREAVEIQFLDE